MKKRKSVCVRTGPGPVWLVFLLVFLVFSCKSMQKDIRISSIDDSFNTDLAELEETIVRLEFAPAANILTETRRKINSLANIPDTDFQALLAAW